MFKAIIFLIFFTSCVSTSDFSAPSTNDPKQDVFTKQELNARLLDIQNDTAEPTPARALMKLTKSPDPTLLIQRDCDKDETNTVRVSTEDILENEEDVRKYIAETRPEYASLSKEDKIKENFKKLGGSSEAIEQALCFFNKHKDSNFHQKKNGKLTGNVSIKNEKYMVVQDFTLTSGQKRFFLVSLEDDPENGKKAGDIDAMYAPHGMGKDNERCGTNNYLKAHLFSNKKGCNLTPRGFMISGDRGTSGYAWKWNMKLHGVQQGLNDNNLDRLIYFHPGISTQGEFLLAEKGRASSLEDNPELFERDSSGNIREYYGQNMTYGCTAVTPDYAEEVYSKTKGGALFYNFTPHEKELGPTYCGGNNLLKK